MSKLDNSNQLSLFKLCNYLLYNTAKTIFNHFNIHIFYKKCVSHKINFMRNIQLKEICYKKIKLAKNRRKFSKVRNNVSSSQAKGKSKCCRGKLEKQEASWVYFCRTDEN